MTKRTFVFLAALAVLFTGCGDGDKKSRMNPAEGGRRPLSLAEKALSNSSNHTMLSFHQHFEVFRMIDWARNNLKDHPGPCPQISAKEVRQGTETITLQWDGCALKAGPKKFLIEKGHDKFTIERNRSRGHKPGHTFLKIENAESDFTITYRGGLIHFYQTLDIHWPQRDQMIIGHQLTRVAYTPAPLQSRSDEFEWKVTADNTRLEFLDESDAFIEHFAPHIEFLHTGKIYYKNQPKKVKENIHITSQFDLSAKFARTVECHQPLGDFEVKDFIVTDKQRDTTLFGPLDGSIHASFIGVTTSFDKRVHHWQGCQQKAAPPISYNLLDSITRLAR